MFTSNAKANGQLDVVASVCNRQVPLQGTVELAAWFTGTGRNNVIDLKSQAGTSHLKATLGQDRVHGMVELPGGKMATFEARMSADAPAGLFDVRLDGQGNLVGTSRGGKTMTLSRFKRDGQLGVSGDDYVARRRGGSRRAVRPWRPHHREGPRRHEVARTIILPDSTSRGILDPIARKGTERSTLSGT